MTKLGISALAGLGTEHGAMLAAEMQRGLDPLSPDGSTFQRSALALARVVLGENTEETS